jgi:hypothetical protein
MKRKRVFISHSSHDIKIATRLYHWLENFQLLGKTWIDIRELKPGMELTESIKKGINESHIVIIIVSRYSKDSDWVKKEIKYSLKFHDGRKKIVIPVLFKIEPEQVSPHYPHFQKLLKRIYVTLDEDLFNIHTFIPSLIPTYYCLEIPFNDELNIDNPQLINNLKQAYESKRKLYPLINHEKIDAESVAVLREALKLDHSGFHSYPQEIIEDNSKIENIIANVLPLFWLNISFVLSKYIQSLSKGTNLEVIATSISKLFREFFHSLFLHVFTEISLSYIPKRKNGAIKKMILESSNYVFPKGTLDVYFYFICNLYYNNRVTPRELIELTFVGDKVKRQRGRVSRDNYKDLLHYPQPAFPLSEIFDSDWYEIIVPQFLSSEIMYHTRRLHTLKDVDLKEIGLHLRDYSKSYYVTYD